MTLIFFGENIQKHCFKLTYFLLYHSKIPPAPPKPDFESPREKMHKLGEGEASMTKEEYAKMKQELEA